MMTSHLDSLSLVAVFMIYGGIVSANDKTIPALSDLKVADITSVRLVTASRSVTRSVEVASDGTRTLVDGVGPKAKSTNVQKVTPQDRDRLFTAALRAMPLVSANGPSSQLSDTISYQLSVEFGNRTEYGYVDAIIESEKELLNAFEEIIATIAPNGSLFNINELRVKALIKRQFPRFGKTLTDADLRGDISQIVKATGKWSVRFSRLGGDHARVSVLDEGPIMIRWEAEEVPIRAIRGNDLTGQDHAQFLKLAEGIRDHLPNGRAMNPNFELIIGCGSRRQSIRFSGLPADDVNQVDRITALFKLIGQCVPRGEDLHFTTEEILIGK